ncbi:hypothetical protein CIK05_05785 [Bdellovibrio sp. qaytius]|nr:hypothetical protein CIK05_05785 [Bdellovibrio sp. qaytius]
MKTLVTLLKLAMLVTTLSFVMSCDKNNKKTNNTAVNTGIYTYGANGSCINNQTGQQMPVTYCQQQYQSGYGYGTQQCNGNSSLFVFLRGQQYACQSDYTQMQNFQQYGGCWVSCAMTSCSGQLAYPGGSSAQSQGYQCL